MGDFLDISDDLNFNANVQKSPDGIISKNNIVLNYRKINRRRIPGFLE